MTQLSSQDDNCQHARLQVWKQLINLGVIVVTDPFASKQSKRVKLRKVFLDLFVCKNFQYPIPNPAGGSMFIALEGLQRLSRAHDHIAIKTHCRHIIFVRHLTSITGSTRRMRSTGPRPRPPTCGHVGLFWVGASHEAREHDKLRSNVVFTRQAEKQRGF